MTKTQKLALEKLVSCHHGSAYSLGVGLNTLTALAQKGFVQAHRSGLGSLFPKRLGTVYYITDKGRRAYRASRLPVSASK